MGRKVDPRDFLLNTDYEMDKIIYFIEGEITDGQTVNIPHKLGFAPLIFGVCAFQKDFSDSRSIPFQVSETGSYVGFSVLSNKTSIRINYGQYNSGYPSTAYYRIYAFEPTNSRAKIGATSKHAKNFILNTDYNYCKLYKAGVVDSSTTIKHDFGYIPQVLAWGEPVPAPGSTNESTIIPIETQSEDDRDLNVTVNSTNLTIPITGNGGKQSYKKIHYRIYYDEA